MKVVLDYTVKDQTSYIVCCAVHYQLLNKCLYKWLELSIKSMRLFDSWGIGCPLPMTLLLWTEHDQFNLKQSLAKPCKKVFGIAARCFTLCFFYLLIRVPSSFFSFPFSYWHLSSQIIFWIELSYQIQSTELVLLLLLLLLLL